MRLAGFASTPAPDSRGRSIAPFAFGSAPSPVDFIIEHDPAFRAGTITSLEVREPTATSRGGLWCTATLDTTLYSARRIADEIASGAAYGFSVGASRDNVGYHNITAATLREISITRYPRNPECVAEWIDRPKVRLWPDEIEKLFEEREAQLAALKPQLEKDRQCLRSILHASGLT